MCGIIYIERLDKKDPERMLRKRYEAQKSRGTDGFGYIAMKEGKVVNFSRSRLEKTILEGLRREVMDSILFHHRTPTSTPNLPELNHPIPIVSKDFKSRYFIVHNGVISNAEELKKEHEKIGIVYQTEAEKQIVLKSTNEYYIDELVFNDSEALGWELALLLEGRKEKIDTRGSAAFIVLQVAVDEDKPIAIYYGRNVGNPLRVEKKDDYFCLSSEAEVGADYVPLDRLYRRDLSTLEETYIELEIGTFYGKQYKTEYNSDWKVCHKNDPAWGKCYCDTCVPPHGSRNCDFTDSEDRNKLILEPSERAIMSWDDYGALCAELDYYREELKRARASDDYDTEMDTLEVMNDTLEQIKEAKYPVPKWAEEIERKKEPVGFRHV